MWHLVKVRTVRTVQTVHTIAAALDAVPKPYTLKSARRTSFTNSMG
jgi:hypothetical protein